MKDLLDKLLVCWRLSSSRHQFKAPASEDAIASAEAKLGHKLPEALCQLFLFSDGLSLFDGNLTIYPLGKAEDELSLTAVTPWLRECEWLIPEQVVIFGDNGCGELFGLWSGDRDLHRFPDPVIQVGQVFEARCMVLITTNFVSFLNAQTTAWLALNGDGKLAVQYLGAPKSLADANLPKESVILTWADPARPDLPLDVYQDPLDAPALSKLLR